MEVKACAHRFHRDMGHSSVQARKKNANEPEGLWNHSEEMIMLHFGGSGHAVFRERSALDRGSLESKKCGKLSMHYTGDSLTAELLFRTIISVNELSVHGAISDCCEELPRLAKLWGRDERAQPSILLILEKLWGPRCASRALDSDEEKNHVYLLRDPAYGAIFTVPRARTRWCRGFLHRRGAFENRGWGYRP